MTNTTFQFGNKEINITLGEGSVWKKDGIERVYYDISITGKANPITKFYKIIQGTTNDKTLTVNGYTFGYEYGFCESKSKRAAVDEAIAELASKI